MPVLRYNIPAACKARLTYKTYLEISRIRGRKKELDSLKMDFVELSISAILSAQVSGGLHVRRALKRELRPDRFLVMDR
ncbi:MAG: hypothetical protein OIN84_13650 [Candidatus Methanoperedens sp.]|nr:hypothetical protein [Candidatus Methanoperedens nitroreducens]MCX9079005.1 hypothetical protein [Candidatus Methanoperedens sp.]